MKIDELRAKAEAGSVVAQSILGISYLHGYEVEQNHQEALRWLTAAATRGASRPSAWLGTMYEFGIAVPVDLGRARQLYEYAAGRGEYFGHLHLARFLASGKDGTVDEPGASREYRSVLQGATGEDPDRDEAEAWLASHPDGVDE